MFNLKFLVFQFRSQSFLAFCYESDVEKDYFSALSLYQRWRELWGQDCLCLFCKPWFDTLPSVYYILTNKIIPNLIIIINVFAEDMMYWLMALRITIFCKFVALLYYLIFKMKKKILKKKQNSIKGWGNSPSGK